MSAEPGPRLVDIRPVDRDAEILERAEDQVLGAFFIHTNGSGTDDLAHIAGTLKPEMFSRRRWELTYAAILRIRDRGQRPDVLNVADELERSGYLDDVGGLDVLATLVDATPTTSQAAEHARIIQDAALGRRLQVFYQEAVRDLAEPGRPQLHAVLARHRDRLEELERVGAGRTARPTLAEVWKGQLRSYLDPERFLLRPSECGMGRDLDRLVGGGLTPGQLLSLVSLGAGIGKTAWLHQFADGTAVANARGLRAAHDDAAPATVVPIVFVSELSTEDLSLRSLARQAGVEGYLLRDPKGERGSRPLADGLTEGQTALRLAGDVADAFQAAARFLTILDRRRHVDMSTVTDAVRSARAFWKSEGALVPAVLVVIDPIHRLLDPTKSEVEALGEVLPTCMNLAQRERAIIMMTSDTTKVAAAGRKDLGGMSRGEELAHAAEMAHRGSYQIVHHADVALGLVTLKRGDSSLAADDAARLEGEPDDTLYAEVVNAKARWDKSGRRAAYFLDPAMFRYRPTTSRALPSSASLEERILAFIDVNPRCSEKRVRDGVKGGTDRIRNAIAGLLSDNRIVDDGDRTTGRLLSIARTTRRTSPVQGPDNPADRAERQGLSGGVLPTEEETPSGTALPLPFGKDSGGGGVDRLDPRDRGAAP